MNVKELERHVDYTVAKYKTFKKEYDLTHPKVETKEDIAEPNKKVMSQKKVKSNGPAYYRSMAFF